MTEVVLLDIWKSFDDVDVIKGVNLRIQSGEFVVFVGPSGCGKSTLLRLIAGLEDLTAGEVEIGGEVVTDVAPSKRGIAMVFQSYALYPHMNVFENMSFGMRLAKVGKQETKRRVNEAADILQLTPLLDRLPKQLSGGQRAKGCHRAGDCPRPKGLPVRRAVVQPRRRIARGNEDSDCQTASKGIVPYDDDLCHS